VISARLSVETSLFDPLYVRPSTNVISKINGEWVTDFFSSPTNCMASTNDEAWIGQLDAKYKIKIVRIMVSSSLPSDSDGTMTVNG
jgi:hypothetical protein